MKRVILVSHKKGGVGKSSIALNLGAALNLMKRHTKVLDLDRASATSSSASDTAAMLASSDSEYTTTLPEVVRYATLPGVAGSASVMQRDAALRSCLKKMTSECEFVVIDAGAGEQEENALAAVLAQLIIIPFPCDPGDYTSTVEFVSMMQQWAVSRDEPLVMRTVLNRYKSGWSINRQIEEVIADPAWAAPAFPVRIPSAIRIPEQTMMGRTAFDLKEEDAARRAFVELAASVLAVMDAAA